METCENCDRQIGELETPCVFSEHVVCSGCHALLAAAEKPLPARVALPATKRCPNCGGDATPIKRLKSDFLTGMILFCIGVLPGVIYMAVTQGKAFYCPACGFKYGDAA